VPRLARLSPLAPVLLLRRPGTYGRSPHGSACRFSPLCVVVVKQQWREQLTQLDRAGALNRCICRARWRVGWGTFAAPQGQRHGSGAERENVPTLDVAYNSPLSRDIVKDSPLSLIGRDVGSASQSTLPTVHGSSLAPSQALGLRTSEHPVKPAARFSPWLRRGL
jgi:hypothetical protein